MHMKYNAADTMQPQTVSASSPWPMNPHPLVSNENNQHILQLTTTTHIGVKKNREKM